MRTIIAVQVVSVGTLCYVLQLDAIFFSKYTLFNFHICVSTPVYTLPIELGLAYFLLLLNSLSTFA